MAVTDVRTTAASQQRVRARSAARAGSVLAALSALAVAMAVVLTSAGATFAIATPVELGTAGSFRVLGGESVTNTGPSVIGGDVGVSPGTSITGFPPGIVVGGVFHAADAVALQAQTDLVTAYDDAAGQAPDAALPPDAGGLTLVPGVYNASSTLGLTGTLTLDAQGDPDAVFVFQVGSSLTTASASVVSLINGTQACNVFWQVGSSATLGTNSTFVGTIMAMTSISATTGASIDGRALARTGSVTLDTNAIFGSACAPPTTTTTTAPTTTAPATTTTAPATTTTGPATTTTAPGTTTSVPATTTSVPGPTTSAAVPTTAIGGATSTTAAGSGTSTSVSPTTVVARATTVAPGGSLPPTGSTTNGTVTIAVVLVLLGASVLLVARARRLP